MGRSSLSPADLPGFVQGSGRQTLAMLLRLKAFVADHRGGGHFRADD